MPSKRDNKVREDWLIATMFMAGIVSFTIAFLTQTMNEPFALSCIVLMTALCEALSVRMYFDGRVSVSFVGTLLSTILFGPLGGVLAASATAMTGYFVASRNPRKLVFNFGHETLAAGITGWSLLALGLTGTNYDIARPAEALIGGVVGAAILFSIDGWSVAGIISITSGRSIKAAYRENFAWLLPHYLVLGVVAGGLAVLYGELGVAAILVLTLPLLLSRYSISQFVEKTRENVLRLERSNEQLQHAYVEIRDMSDELKDAYTGTLESLVTALDVRDQETRGHSVRVATHSLDMAKMLGIKDEEELLTVYRGALMHDVGKIGVPDAILLKPAKLTEEEWEFMRRHPALGYRILAQVPYLRPAAKIVLAHHERWDGDGYPRRLKADDIPLGARIFAICDTYDAIISDRPYRKGQSPDAALAEILRCAGTQFDPKVVEAFEAAFPRWREEDHGDSRKPLYLPAWRDDSDASGRAAG
ncbi:MAG: HD-GYP domain-containing protein [Dehalococcoidia bacterium]